MSANAEGVAADIHVDTDRCQGHARCSAIAPALFELDAHGFVIAGPEPIEASGELLEKARHAELSCPEQAIRVEVR